MTKEEVFAEIVDFIIMNIECGRTVDATIQKTIEEYNLKEQFVFDLVDSVMRSM